MRQRRARPDLEALDDGVGVHQMIGQRIGRLRRPRIDDEVFRGERSQLRTDASHEPESKIDMAEGRARGHEAAGLHDHVRFIQQHAWISFAKEWREPPGGGRSLMVEQAGLGHHEGSDARSGHRRAATIPLSKRGRGIADVGPGERGLERTGHLEADGRHHDAVGRSRGNRLNRNAKAVRGLDDPSHAHGPHLESRHREPGYFDQFVGGLEDVEDGGQAEIEDAVESKDGYAHGKYDAKYGTLAYSTKEGPGLGCVYHSPTHRRSQMLTLS